MIPAIHFCDLLFNLKYHTYNSESLSNDYSDFVLFSLMACVSLSGIVWIGHSLLSQSLVVGHFSFFSPFFTVTNITMMNFFLQIYAHDHDCFCRINSHK